MSDEDNAILDEAGESEPELVVDDVLGDGLRLLELPLIGSAKPKVKNNKNNKAKQNNNK